MPDMIAEARANLRRSWRRAMIYGVAFTIISAVVLAPFFTWLALQVLSFGGAPVATNVDIAGVVASIPGILALLAFSLGTAVILVMGIGGHVVLACDAEHGTPRAPVSAFRASASAAPRLLRPALGLVGIYVLVLVPALVTAYDILRAAALGSSENVFLQVVPASPLGAAGFYALLGLVILLCYWLLIRWTFVLHALLIEDRGLGESMTRSAALVATNRPLVIKSVLGVHGAIILVFALEALLFRGLVWLCFDVIAQGSEAMTIVFAALLVVLTTVVATATAVLATSAAASMATVLWAKLGGEVPAPAHGGERLRLPLPKTSRGILLASGVLLLVGLLFAWPQLEQAFTFQFSPIKVTAHRGSSAAAPENTWAAIKLAMEEKSDYCEIDVLEAKDGAVVLIHDINLRRLAGVNQNVFDLTGDELTKLDVGRWFDPKFEGELMPLLEDVILHVKGKMKLNIEIKVHGRERDIPETVVDLIHKHDFIDECVVTSLDMGILRRVRAKDPKIKIGAIVTASIGNVHALDVDFYSVERAQATVSFIRRSHARGREVHVWTTNAEDTIQRMIDRGADNLITDYPARAVNMRDSRGPDDELRSALMKLFDR